MLGFAPEARWQTRSDREVPKPTYRLTFTLATMCQPCHELGIFWQVFQNRHQCVDPPSQRFKPRNGTAMLLVTLHAQCPDPRHQTGRSEAAALKSFALVDEGDAGNLSASRTIDLSSRNRYFINCHDRESPDLSFNWCVITSHISRQAALSAGLRVQSMSYLMAYMASAPASVTADSVSSRVFRLMAIFQFMGRLWRNVRRADGGMRSVIS